MPEDLKTVLNKLIDRLEIFKTECAADTPDDVEYWNGKAAGFQESIDYIKSYYPELKE